MILQLASGDLRKAITYLQTAQRLHSASTNPTAITAMSSEHYFFRRRVVPHRYRADQQYTRYQASCQTKSLIPFSTRWASHGTAYPQNCSKAAFLRSEKQSSESGGKAGVQVRCWNRYVSMACLDPQYTCRIRKGFTKELTAQLHDALIPIGSIPPVPKSNAALAIAECDKALCEGGDEELQLLDCCLRIREAMTKA